MSDARSGYLHSRWQIKPLQFKLGFRSINVNNEYLRYSPRRDSVVVVGLLCPPRTDLLRIGGCVLQPVSRRRDFTPATARKHRNALRG
jgi:hypothetical protein